MKVGLFFPALLCVCHLVASRHIELDGSLAAASEERIDALASKEELRDRKEEEEEAAPIDAAVSLKQLSGHSVEKREIRAKNTRYGDMCYSRDTSKPFDGRINHTCVDGCICRASGSPPFVQYFCRHETKKSCPGDDWLPNFKGGK